LTFLLLAVRVLAAANNNLRAPLDLRARQQNAVLARKAAQTNIRAKAHDTPFKSTAGMRLA
jgi:hypothetical protein